MDLGSSKPTTAWLGRLALATALLTFPLVLVGGSVTSHDAGMAYPGAPLSNDSILNPAGWTGQTDTLLEHGHRLIGWAVGVLATLTATVACLRERRRFVRRLAIAALGAIVLQGIMGIWRVNHDSTNWAMIHGVWGQLCFATVSLVALLTSRTWRGGGEPIPTAQRPSIRAWSVVLVVLIVWQLTFGVLTRQIGWGFELHLFGAMAVAVLAGRVCFVVLAELPSVLALRRTCIVLAMLVGLQMVLGMTTLVVTGGSSARVEHPSLLEWVVPTAHVATGALILALATCTVALSFQRTKPAAHRASETTSTELTTT